jgi:hypothetical protein
MQRHEAERLAAAIHELRLDWPTASILTIIRENLASRAYRDVAVALVFVACDEESQTPKRVLLPGPWWELTKPIDPRRSPTPPPYREVVAKIQAQHEADTANAPVPPIGEYLKAREELRTEREATK